MTKIFWKKQIINFKFHNLWVEREKREERRERQVHFWENSPSQIETNFKSLCQWERERVSENWSCVVLLIKEWGSWLLRSLSRVDFSLSIHSKLFIHSFDDEKWNCLNFEQEIHWSCWYFNLIDKKTFKLFTFNSSHQKINKILKNKFNPKFQRINSFDKSLWCCYCCLFFSSFGW
jgi:hypothetical protein